MDNIITNQIFLEQQPKFYYIKSTEILPNIPSHEKIRARINFLKKANLTAFIINRGGWIIPQDAFKDVYKRQGAFQGYLKFFTSRHVVNTIYTKNRIITCNIIHSYRNNHTFLRCV